MRVLQRAAQIPVEPQHPVHDDEGRFLARADFWVVGTRRIHEYDGGDHRRPEVQDGDLRRDRSLLEADWQRYGFTSRHLLNEAASIIRESDRLLGPAVGQRPAPGLGGPAQRLHAAAPGPIPSPRPLAPGPTRRRKWSVRGLSDGR